MFRPEATSRPRIPFPQDCGSNWKTRSSWSQRQDFAIRAAHATASLREGSSSAVKRRRVGRPRVAAFGDRTVGRDERSRERHRPRCQGTARSTQAWSGPAAAGQRAGSSRADRTQKVRCRAALRTGSPGQLLTLGLCSASGRSMPRARSRQAVAASRARHGRAVGLFWPDPCTLWPALHDRKTASTNR